MGVQYSVFNDIDIAEFDAVVVGTGFAGAVTARELAERGGKLLRRGELAADGSRHAHARQILLY